MGAITITGTIDDSLGQPATGRFLVGLAQVAYGEAALYLPGGEIAVASPSSVSFSAVPSSQLVPDGTSYGFRFVDAAGRQQMDKSGVALLATYDTLDDFS